MQEADDETLLLLAGKEERVIVSADTDFGALLVLRRMPKPSFVLLRRTVGNRPEQVADILEGLLPRVSADLAKGAVATVMDDRIRIRALPVLP
jgi:predicted nuclease of predicted toxin-antitoxin system